MTLYSISARRPRIGFLGLGWIGRHRMEAMLGAGLVEAAAVADPSPEAVDAALMVAPDAVAGTTLDDILAQDLDGVVIASPSALHAAQSIGALDRGLAVFCQKPLGRDAAEAEAVVSAARRANRLLGVDLSYRHTAAMQAIRPLLQQGQLGDIFAVDLVFHNAYGPDKPWFYDRALSGGGCVMDLGVHLVDLVLWALDFPEVEETSAQLFAGGVPLVPGAEEVEDFATVTLRLAGGTVVRLTCSWKLQAGCDAVIGADFYGTGGGASLRNVNGSFYDFTAQHHTGTASAMLVEPPDDWGGRAATDWARRLSAGAGFEEEAQHLVTLAHTLDGIYGSGSTNAPRRVSLEQSVSTEQSPARVVL